MNTDKSIQNNTYTCWYKKVLKKYKKEIVKSTVSSIVVTLMFSFWYFTSGNSFKWETISPISQPSIFARYFYSAFAFITVGAFLYYVVRLWKGLYIIFGKILGNYPLYEFVKWIVWTLLILITYFYIVPTVVNILNVVISFIYNMSILMLYLYPPVGILGGVFIITYYIFKKLDQRK